MIISTAALLYILLVGYSLRHPVMIRAVILAQSEWGVLII
jgi:hypothetical protein